MPSGWRTPWVPGQRIGTRAGHASGLSCLMGNNPGDPSHTEPNLRRQPQFSTWNMFFATARRYLKAQADIEIARWKARQWVEIERYTAGLLQLATAYVMLADPLSSYVSGATIPVTGGRPFL